MRASSWAWPSLSQSDWSFVEAEDLKGQIFGSGLELTPFRQRKTPLGLSHCNIALHDTDDFLSLGVARPH